MSHQITPAITSAYSHPHGDLVSSVPRRAVFVHEVSYIDKPVFEIHEFPEGLSSVGWEVDFIDFDEDGIRRRRRREAVSRLGGSVINLSSVPSIGSGMFRRLVAVVVGLFWIPWKLHRWRPDVVVLYAVPTFGWQTVLAGRALGIPVVYRAIDLSSEIRETSFSRLISQAERFVACRSTIACSNTNQLGDHLRSLGALDVRRVFPGFDRQPVESLSAGSDADNGATSQHSASVVFMGTLFPFAGLEQLVRLMAPMLRRRPEVGFRILGAGEAERVILATVEEESIADLVEMPGFVPYDQLFLELSRSSVAVIPFDERALTHVALPGKVPQYIRAGLPVVASPLRGLQELLPEGAGVVYRPMGAEFIDAIEQLLDDSEHRQRLVEAGNQRLDVVATWEVALTEFESVLYDVMGKGRRKPNVG